MKRDVAGWLCVADPTWLDFHQGRGADRAVYYKGPKRPLTKLPRDAPFFCCRRGETPRRIHLVGSFGQYKIMQRAAAWQAYGLELGASSLAEWENQIQAIPGGRHAGEISCHELSDLDFVQAPIALASTGVTLTNAASAMGRYLDPNEVARILAQGQLKIAGNQPSGRGILLDPEIRKAVELRAVEMAEAHYRCQSYAVERKGKPYDLRCIKDATEIHVEVKGTSTAGEAVLLTPNEVVHARTATCQVDFYFVSDIVVQRDAQGKPVASAGVVRRHIQGWSPADSDLEATEYRYLVPVP